jgi:hypothetical protein
MNFSCKMVCTALAACGVLAPVVGHAAANPLNFAQRQQQRGATSAATSLVAQANSNLRMFALGAQKYVYANVGRVPWNVSGTTTAISYTPFLLYASGGTLSAAQAEAECGFAYGASTPPGFTSPINLDTAANITPSMSVSWVAPPRYLPTNWTAPLGGVDCAVVWINQPSAQQITVQVFYAPATVVANGNTNQSVTPVQLTYGIKSSSALQSAIPNASIIWASGPTASASTSASAQGQSNGVGLQSSTTSGWLQ